MKNLTSPAAAALFALVAAAAPAQEAPGYSMKADGPRVGTSIPRSIITNAPVPPDKRYEELTPEQRLRVHAQYEGMPAGDEPPYPRQGLAPMLRALHEVGGRLDVRGDFSMFVDVDGQGRAVSVSVLKSPDPRFTQAAASILMLQEYKPAVCSGQPCRMQFPVRLTFTSNL